MNPVLQLRSENLVNQPLSVEATKADKQLGNDQYPEVAFAASVMPCMTFVAVTVVDDVKP